MQEVQHYRISEVLTEKRQWVISSIISRFMERKEIIA